MSDVTARITKLNAKFFDDWKSLVENLDASVMRSFTNFKASRACCGHHIHNNKLTFN